MRLMFVSSVSIGSHKSYKPIHPSSHTYHNQKHVNTRDSNRVRVLCSSSDDTNNNNAHLSAEEKRELARKKRMEAELLQLQSEKALLELERAQLESEKKKLELQKLRLKSTSKDSAKPTPPPSTATPPPDAAAPSTPPPTVPPNGIRATNEPMDAEKLLREISKSSADGKGIPDPMLQRILGMMPVVREDDIKDIREHVLGVNTFFVTNVVKSALGDRVVFEGNMRGSGSAGQVFEEILAKLKTRGDVASRVRLFMTPDPADAARCVIVAVPMESQADGAAEMRPRPARIVFTVIAAALSLFTTVGYSVGVFGLNTQFMQKLSNGDTDEIALALPIVAGTVAVLVAREIATRVVASTKDVKMGAPLFIPSLQLGSYGAITPFQSFPKNRKEFFDISAAAPAVGFVLSGIALVAGLLMTGLLSSDVADLYPRIPMSLFNSSLLLATCAKTLLPQQLLQQATISVHPLVVVGYTGFLINALNMIPFGRLDGGRIVKSIVGRTTANTIGGFALLIQGFSSVFGDNNLLLIWGLIAIFLRRESEVPCLDEVTEPNEVRNAFGFVLLLLMLFTLFPLPTGTGA